MAAKKKRTRSRTARPRGMVQEEMRMVRVTTATPYPVHPGDQGIVEVPGRVAKALLDSRQAIPVCGTVREIQIANLCTAAEALGVTLTTSDPEIDAAALTYGARCTLTAEG